jgi:hypothetical protein
MKLSAVSVLLAASLIDASPFGKRQESAFISAMVAMVPDSYKASPSAVQDLKPKIRSGAIRKVARYGPFTLPANKVDMFRISYHSVVVAHWLH